MAGPLPSRWQIFETSRSCLAGDRPGRTHIVHHRMAARHRHAAPRPYRLEQGRGTSRPERCSSDRASGRNPRPYHGRTTLPHRWPQSADRHHHLLEFQTARKRCGKATAGRIGLPTRTPRPHIAAWVGPYHPNRRISLAENRSAKSLKGFSALSPTRPHSGGCGAGLWAGRG